MNSRRGGERDRRTEFDDDRDHVDRRRDRDPDSRNTRGDPQREPKRAKGGGLNEFFVDGEGIHRDVLQKEICRFLGPEAHSNPKTYKGVDGYMIKAVRPFTHEMLDDLINLSEKYVSERDDMRRKGRGALSYGDSLAGRRSEAISRQDIDMDDDDSYDDDPRSSRGTRAQYESREPREIREFRNSREPRFSSANPYAPVTTQNAYGPVPAYATQPPGIGYAHPVYPQGAPNPPQGPNYPLVPGYPANPISRPGPSESPYVYAGGEYGNSSDPYARLPPSYAPPGGREPIRQDTNRGYGANSRMDSRDIRDSRPAEPRYSGYPVSSPTGGDAPMSGMDGERYDYAPTPPLPSGRGYQPSAKMGPYDRPSPEPREPYRRELPREERRRGRRDQ